MPEIITKPKDWKSLIIDMNVTEILFFPVANHAYVRSMISGPIKQLHPTRVYKTNKEPKKVKVTRLS